MKKIALIMTAVAALTACSDGIGSQQQQAAGRVATDFAEAYFDMNYLRANDFVTTESAKWLAFVATNIGQEDIDVANTRNEGARVTLTSCEALNDTTCEALLEVDNYVAADSIGRPAVVRDGGVFRLKVVLRDGRWQVRMEGLPRSEKHSRD